MIHRPLVSVFFWTRVVLVCGFAVICVVVGRYLE